MRGTKVLKFAAVAVVLVATLFLAFACLDGRSTPGRIIRWLEGEGLIEQYCNDLAEDTKKAVDPLDIQRWAVTVLRETRSERPEVRDEEIPPIIRNLRSRGSPFEFITCDSDDSASPKERSVCIWWGGGFGHWGIRAGAPTFRVGPASEYNPNVYVEWRPGIYFVREL